MSEQTAWTTMRGHLTSLPGRVHIQRFEDKLTGGIPDTNVCWAGHEFWMEAKFVKDLPKRPTTKVKVGLRPDQALWLETRQRAGSLAFVWIRVRDYGWLLFDGRYRALQDGIPLEDFMNEPVYANCKELVAEIARRVSCSSSK